MSAIEMYDTMTAVQCEQLSSRFVTLMHDRAVGKRSQQQVMDAMVRLWLQVVEWTTPAESPRS